MTLAVLSVAYPFAPVGPDAVGGAEQGLGAIDAAIFARDRPNLVHLHGIDFAPYCPRTGPTIVTLHPSLDGYDEATLRSQQPGLRMHGVSASQCALASEGVRLAPPVPNGVDLSAPCPASSGPGGAFVEGSPRGQVRAP